MHKEKVIIGSNDVDSSLTVKLSSLFKIMQDVIMHHTEELNVGVSETNKKGILWVISRASLDINRLPTYQEEVECLTYPGKAKLGMLFPRYFEMKDKKGNVLFRFSSIWALIDEKSRKPIVSEVIANRTGGEEKENQLPLPEKIKEEPASFLEERKIRYSDVDLNGHLNNTRYIEILNDIHTNEFYKNHKISQVTLNYIKEIKEGQSVKVYAESSDKDYVKVTVDDELSFLAKIEYK